MAFEIPSKLSKTLTGKIQVNYGCPNCGLELNNLLDEAGNKDTCPGCSAGFVVPGEVKRRELEKLQAEQHAKEEEKQRQKVAQQIEHVEQSRKKQIELQQLAEQQQQLLAEQKRSADEKAQQELRKLHSGHIYHVENFNPVVNGCDKKMTDMLNHFAAQGWEYVGFEIVHTYEPPGCLAGILGQSGAHIVYHLVTFKKPLPK